MIKKIFFDNGTFYQLEGKPKHRIGAYNNIVGHGLYISRYDPSIRHGTVVALLSCSHGKDISRCYLEEIDLPRHWKVVDAISSIDDGISCEKLSLDDAFYRVASRTEKYFHEHV